MKVKLGFERAVQLWKALRGQPLRELCSRLRDPRTPRAERRARQGAARGGGTDRKVLPQTSGILHAYQQHGGSRKGRISRLRAGRGKL